MPFICLGVGEMLYSSLSGISSLRGIYVHLQFVRKIFQNVILSLAMELIPG